MTIEFYNQIAEEFCRTTVNNNLQPLYDTFVLYLNKGDHILDAGCGSGRDSLYFINEGYEVTAMDASEKMVQHASKLINKEVYLKTFQQIEWQNKFNAIWACASLLHVPNIEIVSVFEKLSNSLKLNGIIQASFKYGTEERQHNNRFFLDMNEENIEAIINKIPALKIEKTFVSNDVRQGREKELWLNIIVRKII